MKILDGKRVSTLWSKGLKTKLRGRRLDGVMIGADKASALYLQKKGEMARELGVEFVLHHLPATTTTRQAVAVVEKLNANAKTTGIIVQLPLPSTIDEAAVVEAIAPYKDVDGLTTASLVEGKILPATARGVVKLLAHYKIPMVCQSVALVGFSRLLNVALSVYFSKLGNEIVILQKGTRDMHELKKADIIITATGVAKLIGVKEIASGAVVIDAGISRVGSLVTGDVDAQTLMGREGFITPVPGGVGPMTVVALFANLTEL